MNKKKNNKRLTFGLFALFFLSNASQVFHYSLLKNTFLIFISNTNIIRHLINVTHFCFFQRRAQINFSTVNVNHLEFHSFLTFKSYPTRVNVNTFIHKIISSFFLNLFLAVKFLHLERKKKNTSHITQKIRGIEDINVILMMMIWMVMNCCF